MIQYIYFVKCPNCEDEHFDFFDDAKGNAMGRLSQKPIITQTEVNRNDFGECTDSTDLGTIWSWEDEVGGMTDAEPTISVFTKDNLKRMADGKDPEFDDDDFFFMNNSLSEDVKRRISFKNNADFDEFIRLCSEIGIVTGGDLTRFMDENDATDFNLLDKLREYRAELGPDFQIQESTEITEGEERLATNAKGDYLVKASSGHGYTVFNRSDVAIGGFGGDDDAFAVRRFKVGDINESKKPVIGGKTIKELVETMEENEDQVECAGCEELFNKDECTHKDGIGYLCGDCEDRIVKCTWCEELYDKGECRYEVDLGWLCSRCEMAIKSRGETLTFREGSYWDFLDEDLGDSRTLRDLVKDSINHFVNDLGKDPWADDFADDVIADLEANYDLEVPSDMTKYSDWCSAVASEVSRQVNSQLNENAPKEVHDLGNTYDGGYPEVAPEDVELEEAAQPRETVDLEYDALTITLCGNKRDVDDWDEIDHTDSYTYTVDKGDVATTIWENFITEEDVTDVPGGLEALEDDETWEKFLEDHFDGLFEKYYDKILDYYEESAAEEFQDNYSYSDYQADREADYADMMYDAWRDSQFDESAKAPGNLDKLEEAKDYSDRMETCPECGDKAYDGETGFCIHCGFNH